MIYFARLSKEGRRTLAEFPDCPGCQTYAEPGEDVTVLAKDALDGWLEAHLMYGEAPPQPKARVPAAVRLAVRVTPMLAVRLQLRWARQSLGISQGELARRVGVSRQQISLLESPDANLTLATLEKVAESLGMELEIELSARDSAA
jgi:DNA-binding XRE family transcriptional regulator/predicted RNase H-like HicB family nuclease